MSLRYRIIPRATYQRSRVLNQQHSETVERLARIYAMARALWQDDRAAQRFLLSPHPELRGKSPLDAALTEIGGRQVEEIIERVKVTSRKTVDIDEFLKRDERLAKYENHKIEIVVDDENMFLHTPPPAPDVRPRTPEL